MTSLYRKWRSRSFEDLYGQDHVVRTLRNAVRQHRVAHAYLFTGPRGTGKTSAARILAKAVNCLNPDDGNPCTVCEACRAAQEGRALDVIEIDAASNTSVDNVRDLRERVAYAAGEGQYKVYIVDEVHRLSGAAFDAFLKTLEEPPPHVIFVFASTEPHKVPATIASRCQRFDFHRIASREMLARLHEVAGEEALGASDGALALIAQHANGSLRDGLSLLDQASAYGKGSITEEDIRQSLGLADPAVVGSMTDCLLSGALGEGLNLAAQFLEGGGDAQQLLEQLIGYWRALLLMTSGAGQAELTVDPGLHSDLQRHASQLDAGTLVRVLHTMADKGFSPKYDLVASLSLELAFVQAALAVRGTVPAVELARPQSKAGPAVTPPVVKLDPPPDPITTPLVSEPAAPAPVPSPEPEEAVRSEVTGGSVEQAWPRILECMREKSRQAQAVLRSGFLLKAENGEVTIGFQYEFHSKQFNDPRRRKLVEEAISEVLGVSYRVQCIRASQQEIEEARGAGLMPDDDGFVDEVAEKLRQFHARQMTNGNS